MNARANEQDKLLSDLLAKEEIRQLTSIYCYHVIMSNGEALSQLFVEDGKLTYGDTVIEGREALAAMINGVGQNAPVPMIHNHVIDVQGDDATGTCVVESPVGNPGGGGGFVAYYNDRYRREGGRWRFVSRTVGFLVADGAQVERSGDDPFGRSASR